LSNNRNNNNNRRRGRGNNRSQGGGNQLNRIDSRARGNAPQLLEKYKKLAHDAALNGDRVQAEYYLQFADHYFRVLADSRSAKDDPRGPRREFDREPGDDQDYFDDEFDRGQRQDTRRRDEPAAEDADDGRSASGSGEFEGDAYEAADNPFTRPAADKQRRGRRERAEVAPEAPDAPDADDDAGNRLDPSVLPGAIAASESEAEEAPEREPASQRRGLKPRSRTRARGSDDDEELEAVG
jgi:hypothetical protein